MALTSCAGFNSAQKDKTLAITDTQVITETEYLPGKTVIAEITAPDSKVLEDCGTLTDKFIPDGPDIKGDDAVNTAAAWGSTAIACRDKNLVLKGWILGVVAVRGERQSDK
jgi:hypothetical protein